MLEDFDPSTIEDEGLRQIVMYLMNMVENLSAKVAEQAEEIQRLRDENNRLKGEQGKPRVLPNKGRANLSSEKERRKSKPHHKANKQAHIQIDREVVVKVDQERLPADAVFKGYEEVVVQDLEFRTDTIRFRKEKYYSPGQKQTYLAELPAGYQGQFGPGVRAWVLALYFASRMSPRDAQRGANKQAKNTCPRRKWEKKPGDKEISINGKARFSSISSGRGKRKQLESAFTPERGEQIHRCWQT